jgi:hypothetical protein
MFSVYVNLVSCECSVCSNNNNDNNNNNDDDEDNNKSLFSMYLLINLNMMEIINDNDDLSFCRLKYQKH